MPRDPRLQQQMRKDHRFAEAFTVIGETQGFHVETRWLNTKVRQYGALVVPKPVYQDIIGRYRQQIEEIRGPESLAEQPQPLEFLPMNVFTRQPGYYQASTRREALLGAQKLCLEIYPIPLQTEGA
jgi:hypothetical protein